MLLSDSENESGNESECERDRGRERALRQLGPVARLETGTAGIEGESAPALKMTLR
jgi:hypothetical protein